MFDWDAPVFCTIGDTSGRYRGGGGAQGMGLQPGHNKDLAAMGVVAAAQFLHQQWGWSPAGPNAQQQQGQ